MQHVFADAEVPALHPALGALNGVGHHARLNGHIVLNLQAVHHGGKPFAAKKAHQIVLQGDVEPAFARVSLAAGAAPQLVVNAAALMALGANDIEAAQRLDLLGLRGNLGFVFPVKPGKGLPGLQNVRVLCVAERGSLHQQLLAVALFAHFGLGHKLRVAAQADVRAASGHVGGDGHRSFAARLGHNLGFLLVELGVKHLMLHAAGLQQLAEHLRLLDGNGAHQNRLAFLVVLHNVLNHRLELGLGGFVNHVRAVLPDHGPVGGNLHHVQLVDFREFLLLGHGRAGHAGELLVHAEIVLKGDGGQGFALPGHLHALLGLNGLVQALVKPAAVHQAAGEFIDDDNLAVLHHIILVPVHNAPGPDSLVHPVLNQDIFRVRKVFQVEELLGLFHALAGQGAGLELFVDNIIVPGVQLVVVLLLVSLLYPDGLEAPGQGVGLLVDNVSLGALAGNNKRRACLVNEDGIHLVHNGVVVAPLYLAVLVDHHVIPQVVKAQLVVGAIGDVAGVSGFFVLRAHARQGQAYAKAHKVEHPGHHLALVLGQVLVHCNHMHAFTRKGVQIGGQRQREGFALAGLHFGNAPLVQNDAALNLHGKQALTEHPVHSLPAGGKGLGQNVVQRLPFLQQLAKPGGFGLEGFIIHAAVCLLQGQHPGAECASAPACCSFQTVSSIYYSPFTVPLTIKILSTCFQPHLR